MTALAAAARFETNERLQRYPGLVARGKIGAQAAEDDAEAWDTIADAFERPTATGVSIEAAIRDRRGPSVGCYQIRDALDRATATRNAACAKAPDDTALAARRDAVAAIAAAIGDRIQFWCDLNDTLRTNVIPAPEPGRALPTAKAA